LLWYALFASGLETWFSPGNVHCSAQCKISVKLWNCLLSHVLVGVCVITIWSTHNLNFFGSDVQVLHKLLMTASLPVIQVCHREGTSMEPQTAQYIACEVDAMIIYSAACPVEIHKLTDLRSNGRLVCMSRPICVQSRLANIPVVSMYVYDSRGMH